jgi:CubicO group peptidase (beta-lactamase class C family)
VSHKDFGRAEAPSDKTLHTLCSISKTMVSAAVGLLVEDGMVKWKDPVGRYLPGFNPRGDSRIAREATFNDLLRHSGGLSNPVVTILGPGGKVLVPQQDFLDAVNSSPTGDRDGQYFRRSWEYSNVAYGLIALVIEEVSGIRFADFVKRRILDPLNMHHTAVYSSQIKPGAGRDIAVPSVRLSDGTWAQLEHEWTSEENTPILAMVGIRSSVKDLLLWSAAVLHAGWGNPETLPKVLADARVKHNPLRQMDAILNKSYWTRDPHDSISDVARYHLGWLKVQLPSSMLSWVSCNALLGDNDSEPDLGLLEESILGREMGSEEIIMYKASGIGYCGTCSVNLFPKTGSAVVVLTNGLNRGDPSDFTASLLIQELFDLQPRVDILPTVKAETERRTARFSTDLTQEWLNHRDISNPEGNLLDYEGRYQGLGISVQVRRLGQDPSRLELVLNGREDITQLLEYYNTDQYSYLPTKRDTWLKGGWLDWDYYLVGILDFLRNEDGVITGFYWVWERGAEPYLFARMP